jgi:transaldolase
MATDVQRACDMFLPLYKETNGTDGFVSLELDPTKANETESSIAQAHELWKAVDRPNLMLKVPGTEAGLPVLEELIFCGYNVNVTLLFSEERYREVMDRYMKGLERRVADGKPISDIASVASFFVSRVESEVDKQLDAKGTEQAKALKGKIAVANARVAYAAYQEVLENSDRFAKLSEKGGQLQRPLWASTSTKDPAYPDTMYVDELIGPNCVNTLPEETLEAALDHGKTAVTLTKENETHAREQLKRLKEVGVDLHQITNVLLVEEGVEKFAKSYESLLSTLSEALESARSAGATS